MKKQICFIGITAVLLFSGCGSHVEDGDETIVLQTPVIETAVGQKRKIRERKRIGKKICCRCRMN